VTPLAHSLLRGAVEGSGRGMFGYKDTVPLLLDCLRDVHCFEVSAAAPMLVELCAAMLDKYGDIRRVEDVPPEQSELVGRHVFLPAPKTWIEWRAPWGERVALLLQAWGGELDRPFADEAQYERARQARACSPWGGGAATAVLFTPESLGFIGLLSTASDDCVYAGGRVAVSPALRAAADSIAPPANLVSVLLGMGHHYLMLINSPKLVGRTDHTAHRSLQRQVAQHERGWNLRDWTEIKLQVTKPRGLDDGEPHADQITGKRALHFVRKFIRVRLGKLEYVSAHWRGDPALGVCRADYTLAH
jgi:hypothetical protein